MRWCGVRVVCNDCCHGQSRADAKKGKVAKRELSRQKEGWSGGLVDRGGVAAGDGEGRVVRKLVKVKRYYRCRVERAVGW